MASVFLFFFERFKSISNRTQWILGIFGILFGVAFLFLPIWSPSPKKVLLPGVETLQEKSAALQAYGSSLVHALGFRGVILVWEKGRILHYASHGPREREAVFPIMSMSKQFTGFLIAQLFANGQLDSTKTVGDCVEELADLSVGRIKVSDLLGHTSGLPHFLPLSTQLKAQWSKRPWNTDEYIDVVAELPVSTSRTFVYSDQGYSLLRVIVERAGADTYQKMLRKVIFESAGMHNTFVEPTDVDTSKPHLVLASFLYPQQPVVVSGIVWNTSPIRGATGIYSTAEDLLRWFEFLKKIHQDSPELTEMFFTPNAHHYANGLYVGRLKNDHKMYWHSGYVPGYHSFIAMSFDADVCIVLLSNATCFSELNRTPVKGLLDIMRGNSYTLFK